MLQLSQFSSEVSPQFTLRIDNLAIEPLQHTVILGINGSGKSLLLDTLMLNALMQKGPAKLASMGEMIDTTASTIAITTDNTAPKVAPKVAQVSVSEQQAIIEFERKKDSADILDVIPEPSSTYEVITRDLATTPDEIKLDELKLDENKLAHYASLLGIQDLLQSEFLSLSTGETKKALIVRALLTEPDYLLLDEPFDGLDQQACVNLKSLLNDLAQQITIVSVVNRLVEVPEFTRQIVLLREGTIQHVFKVENDLDAAMQHCRQLLGLHKSDIALPGRDDEYFCPALQNADNILVKLVEGRVAFEDKVIFEHLNWQINAGEHWQVKGPNGSGKTCLLDLITGDNPQCYTNELHLFGYRRGSGESIWEIKQYIGLLSNHFHLSYRVNCSALDVILSGFFDSIGLYTTPSGRQRQLAREWLQVIGLVQHHATPFQRLSFGDQRMLLIARAMVKHPVLLILDEPTNGLDQINRVKVLQLIELLAERGGSTILYVNHNPDETVNNISRCLDMLDYAGGASVG